MMKFAAALLALAAVGVKAQYNATTTVITTDFTTYCSEATIFSHGGNTYTVTEPTVVTVTDCPCTLTRTPTPSPSTVLYTSCSSISGAPSNVAVGTGVYAAPSAPAANPPAVSPPAVTPPAVSPPVVSGAAPVTPAAAPTTTYLAVSGAGAYKAPGMVAGALALAGALVL